jgi:hypothetical protein
VIFSEVTLATHSPDNSKRFAKLINERDEVQEAIQQPSWRDQRDRISLPALFD